MERYGTRIFGLLGSNLSHSFSQKYFVDKFFAAGLNDCEYRNYELANLHGFPALVKSEPNLKGLNVTYPYKEAIIEYLDELSDEARAELKKRKDNFTRGQLLLALNLVSNLQHQLRLKSETRQNSSESACSRR